MGLLPRTLQVAGGEIRLEGEDLTQVSAARRRSLRGSRMAMVFQEPMSALNPVMSCGAQIDETLRYHTGMSAGERRARARELMLEVALPEPERLLDAYPHQLSGGQRQRVGIAIALALEPALLIADEPTTALDVTIQAQILDLLVKLREETGTGIVLITHDLGVVAEVCDDVAVMYAGEIVEQAPADRLFAAPQHPYTVGLLGSVPLINAQRQRLATIPGNVASLSAAFTGCRFAARCPFSDAHCRSVAPPLAEIGRRHLSRCWKAPLEALVA